MSMHICSAGRALILNWGAIDEIGKRIAEKFFHKGINVVGQGEVTNVWRPTQQTAA